MNKLSEKRVLSYATTNLILLLTNIVLFVFTYDNPLTMTWVMIVYLVLATLSIIYQFYIVVKLTVKQEYLTALSIRYKIFDWTSFVLLPVSIFIMVFANILVPGRVYQRSMEPTLQDGQNILIYKFEYKPKRNDIVIIENKSLNGDNSDFIIKRIIAVPGDRIRFRRIDVVGQLFINNAEFISQAQKQAGKPTHFTVTEYYKLVQHQFNALEEPPFEITLAEGYYIALGDNFENSTDSRDLGAFHISQIGGKMIWPIKEWYNESNPMVSWSYGQKF